ncbi:DCL family protein [Variovorax boronicumulans]|uniref:DCL family protein n=1 Tax=Variovorax boronicumulans TaxID=436515 RepID=UPI00277E7317|nr:DCL family protein [Variovorax boronicumulans]MDQ0042820.1 hypothetical protein [Variovorax boronicumulans]
MAKPVTLSNGRGWSTRSAALKFFKEMLARYDVGDTVGSPGDHADLLALLVRYDAVLTPGEQGKIGVGVSHFSKQWASAEGYSTACFYVHRIDGTIDDFSCTRAINEG